MRKWIRNMTRIRDTDGPKMPNGRVIWTTSSQCPNWTSSKKWEESGTKRTKSLTLMWAMWFQKTQTTTTISQDREGRPHKIQMISITSRTQVRLMSNYRWTTRKSYHQSSWFPLLAGLSCLFHIQLVSRQSLSVFWQICLGYSGSVAFHRWIWTTCRVLYCMKSSSILLTLWVSSCRRAIFWSSLHFWFQLSSF